MLKNLQKWAWRLVLFLCFALSLLYVLIQLNGLRIDFYTNEIRRTGIVALSYKDPLAQVSLDEVDFDGGVPFYATGVLPGKYRLKVRKPGYTQYNLPIEVFIDRITRITSVFLVPLDLKSHFENVFNVDVLNGDVFGDGEYVFWLEAKILKWKRLTAAGGQSFHVQIPFNNLSSIEVVSTNEAVLYDRDSDKRAILSLDKGSVLPIVYSTNYHYVGNRWLYVKNDVITLLNKELNQLIWERTPRPGVKISNVKMFTDQGRVFLNVKFNAPEQYAFYEVKRGGDFVQLSDRNVTWVSVNDDGNVNFLVSGRELWKYFFEEKKSVFKLRFSKKIRFLNANLTLHGSDGLLLFADEKGIWLADKYMLNVVNLVKSDMYPFYVYLSSDGNLFWGKIENNTEENKDRKILNVKMLVI